LTVYAVEIKVFAFPVSRILYPDALLLFVILRSAATEGSDPGAFHRREYAEERVEGQETSQQHKKQASDRKNGGRLADEPDTSLAHSLREI